MKREEARDWIPLLEAYKNGKTIEYKGQYDANWQEREVIFFNDSIERYRVKPESKLRPWKTQEVPLGAIVRSKQRAGSHSSFLITGRSEAYIHLGHAVEQSYDYMLKKYEYSTDGGKTWLPCGVAE